MVGIDLGLPGETDRRNFEGMMKRYYLLLSGALLSSLPALAMAQDVSADALYSAAYDTCMEEAKGVTAGMVECIAEEFERQDTQLNEVYVALRGDLSGERRKALRDAQRRWISYRDANCGFYASADGTLARVSGNLCMLRETAERARELESMQGE
ncbi:lysozyme inhibitor LprI family protein [Halomonas sp. HNIBRBA4712]|uniref:lysozyme inhibitor LprI family protein n=1 Tax=Halomonas sp. HNIBRBA4712 TaxID=3373087 RepID=UPI003746C8F3